MRDVYFTARYRRRNLSLLTAAATTGALVTAGIAVAGAATAATLPTNCSQLTVGGIVSCTFGYTGGAQSFTVPTGVSSLSITATGAGGAGYAPAYGRFGGSGASVVASFGVVESTDTSGALRSGQVLTVLVGGAGQAGSSATTADGGFNGGGSSPSVGSGFTGGGGGGASDVRTDGTTDLATKDSRLLVGGGGGGEGDCFTSRGGDAGYVNGAGADGQIDSTCPTNYRSTQVGGGGTQQGGGSSASGPGTRGNGGSGGDNGGGGGGGYYGGGGGLAVGGGGGSSFVDTAFPGRTGVVASYLANNSYRNGSVVISYSPGSAQSVVVSPAKTSLTLGESTASTAITYDANGASVADVTNSATFTVTGPNGEAGTCSANTCTPSVAGSNAVSATYGSLTDDAALSVSKATPTVAVSATPPAGPTYPAGETFTATITGPTGAAAPSGTVSFSATRAGAQTAALLCSAVPLSTSTHTASCTGSSALTPGTYDVSATYNADSNYLVTSGLLPSYVVRTGSQSINWVSVPTSASPRSSAQVSAVGGGSSQPVVLSVDPTSTSGTCTLTATGNGTATVNFGGAGQCVLDADQAGDANYAAATQVQQVIAVDRFASAVSVTTPSTSSAGQSVTASAKVTGPAGTVQFTIDGSFVGSPVQVSDNGTVTSPDLGVNRAPGSYSVSARFSPGSADWADSAATPVTLTITRVDPTITATVSSGRPKTNDGWYGEDVTVTFTCTPGSAPLTAACPAPVTLTEDGADQSVTRTITATDGGTATAAITGLNLDSTRPSVTTTGVANRSTVFAGDKPACTGTDALSGVASCTVTITQISHSGSGLNPTVYGYAITAIDKAGNATTATGRYTSLGIYLAGASYRDGVFHVKYGESYPVTVTGYSSTPTFQYAVGFDGTPIKNGPKLVRTGPKTWAITLPINKSFASRHDWNIGVLTGDGVQHVIHLHQ